MKMHFLTALIAAAGLVCACAARAQGPPAGASSSTAGGSGSGLPAGPTTPNSRAQFCTETPVGGVAPANCTWGLAGDAPTDRPVGESPGYTFAATDIGTSVRETNPSGETFTIPDGNVGAFILPVNIGIIVQGGASTLQRQTSSQIRCTPNGALANTCNLVLGAQYILKETSDFNYTLSVSGDASSGTISSCATTNAITKYTASTTVGCGNADFTIDGTAHTLLSGAAGIVNFGPAVTLTIPNNTNALTFNQIKMNSANNGFQWYNGAGSVYGAAAGTPGNSSTTCTNQVVTAVFFNTAPTCSTIPAAALPNGIANFNQAAQSQVVVSGTEYYITKSDLDMPATYLTAIAAGTTMSWRIALTKTAAGTGTFQILLKKGTNGSTADTSIVTQTIGTQTAAVDNMECDIQLTWTSATAAYWTIIPHQAAATGTGFGLVYPATAAQFTGTISGQTTTTASDKYGLSVIFTTGTPTFVVNYIKAQAFGVN
jgi:hypothetical protein